jgi:HprK-related kinase A
MIVGELRSEALERRLKGPGLLLTTGPFVFRIRSPLENVRRGLSLLYERYPLAADDAYADYTVDIEASALPRRWWRPQARFVFDGQSPFEPLPVNHAFPLLEWSMNWCLAGQAHHHLLLHAAVVERDGRAAILPAPPGSGKSTLCAALIHRGWRLMSDEMAIITLDDAALLALGRPVSLKNQSIALMRNFEPSAVFNEVSLETTKGSVTHMQVPAAQVDRLAVPARAAWVVFPRYVPAAAPTLTPRSRAGSLLELGRNAFNYMVLGAAGFNTLANVLESCQCFDFSYSQLDDAVAVFEALAAQP